MKVYISIGDIIGLACGAVGLAVLLVCWLAYRIGKRAEKAQEKRIVAAIGKEEAEE